MSKTEQEKVRLSIVDSLALVEDADGNAKLYRNGSVFAEWHYDEVPSVSEILNWLGISVHTRETNLEYEKFPENLADLKDE